MYRLFCILNSTSMMQAIGTQGLRGHEDECPVPKVLWFHAFAGQFQDGKVKFACLDSIWLLNQSGRNRLPCNCSRTWENDTLPLRVRTSYEVDNHDFAKVITVVSFVTLVKWNFRGCCGLVVQWKHFHSIERCSTWAFISSASRSGTLLHPWLPKQLANIVLFHTMACRPDHRVTWYNVHVVTLLGE